MKIEIEIDEDALKVPIKSALSTAVAQEVRNQVDKRMDKYQTAIEDAVRIYLEKRLTKEEIGKMINDEVKMWVSKRIDELIERENV